jgi:hypothetical protein
MTLLQAFKFKSFAFYQSNYNKIKQIVLTKKQNAGDALANTFRNKREVCQQFFLRQ